MELIKKICSKMELDKILKKKKILSQFVSFIDAFGERNFAYILNVGGSYCVEICDGYITYNESQTLSRSEIEKKKKEEFLREPFNNGVLYEVDSCPLCGDYIEYPIKEVQFLTEDEMIKELVLCENNSILNLFMKEA